MTKHIGIDIRTLMLPVKTGIGEYTFELLNAIFKLDTTNYYYLFYNTYKKTSFTPTAWDQSNIHFIDTHYPNKLFNGSVCFLKQPKIDQLILKKASLPKLDIFFSPHLNFTALSNNTKHLLTIHDLSFKFFPHFFSKKQRLWHALIQPQVQIKRASTIITPSLNTKRDLINYFSIPEAKIKVIYPGLGIEQQIYNHTKAAEIKQKYNLPDYFILFLGTNEPRKNILGLVKAYELAYPHLDKKYDLIIAGSTGWNNKELYEYLKYSPVKDSIKLLGYIEDAEKLYLYKLSSLFIYPSFYEGFGFPVLEALALGTPVITSHSSIPEITDASAYLINPHKPTSIAQAIQLILTNEHIKNRLITNGIEQTKKFNWKNAAEEWLKITSPPLPLSE